MDIQIQAKAGSAITKYEEPKNQSNAKGSNTAAIPALWSSPNSVLVNLAIPGDTIIAVIKVNCIGLR